MTDKMNTQIAECYLENILYQIVYQANNIVEGNGCSIFLKEEKTNRFVLRESTILTNYLGTDFIEVLDKDIKNIKSKRRSVKNISITKTAIISKETQNIPDLNEDERWSYYGQTKEEREKNSAEHHCELSPSKAKSLIACPLILEDGEIVGVIRVVLSTKNKKKKEFSDKDVKDLKKYLEENVKKIHGSVSLSKLIEMGSMLDLKELCMKATDILAKMLNAKGCSIFLLDDDESTEEITKYRCFGTTGLYFGKGKEKGKEISDPYKRAVYEYKKKDTPNSLTVAVIKKRENFIITNLAEYNPQKDFDINRQPGPGYFSEIHLNEDNLIPAGAVPTGAVVYAPLFYPDRFDKEIDPLGVIRITRPAGDIPFEDTNIRFFFSFAQKLSIAIINSKFMSLLNKFPGPEIPEYQKQVSFRKILKQAAEFVGGRGCSLFIKRNNNLELYSTYSKYMDVQKIEPYPLGEYKGGYTCWIAEYKQPLLFNSPKELDEKWDSLIPKPKHSGRKACEIKNSPPEKFLGIPIVNQQNKLLGVLRTVKTATDTPFTENHKMILLSLATRFSPLLENINSLDKYHNIKKIKMNDIFTNKLIEKCAVLNKGLFYEDVQTFFDIKPLDERPIAIRTLESVTSMWKKPNIFGKPHANQIHETLNFFNEKFMEGLPYYRDHFIHQYQVFLIGSYIIHELNNTSYPYSKKYAKSLNLDYKLEEKEHFSEISWLVTSTFHDIAFSLTQAVPWLTNIIHIYFGLSKEEKILDSDIDFVKIFYYTNTKKYLSYLDQLINFGKDKGLIPSINEADFRGFFQCEVNSKDHGALASLILVSNHPQYKNEIFLPSSLAIALHKNLGLKVLTDKKLEYSNFPLFFLLMYCDIVQEWGRKENPVKLDELLVTDKKDNIPDNIKQHIPLEIIHNNKTVYVISAILMDDPGGKIEECKNWFNILKSKNPYFCVLVNGELFGSWP